VLVLLLDPGLNEMSDLTNVDLTTFTGDAVDTSCFQAKVILDRTKDTGNLPRWEAYSFHAMSLYHPSDAVENRFHKA